MKEVPGVSCGSYMTDDVAVLPDSNCKVIEHSSRSPLLKRKMGHTIRRLLCNMCTHVCVSGRGRVCACVCMRCA